MTRAGLAYIPLLSAAFSVRRLAGFFTGSDCPLLGLLRREWAGAVAGGGGDMEPAAAWGRRAARPAPAGRLDPVKKLWTAHPFGRFGRQGMGCFALQCRIYSQNSHFLGSRPVCSRNRVPLSTGLPWLPALRMELSTGGRGATWPFGRGVRFR